MKSIQEEGDQAGGCTNKEGRGGGRTSARDKTRATEYWFRKKEEAHHPKSWTHGLPARWGGIIVVEQKSLCRHLPSHSADL